MCIIGQGLAVRYSTVCIIGLGVAVRYSTVCIIGLGVAVRYRTCVYHGTRGGSKVSYLCVSWD